YYIPAGGSIVLKYTATAPATTAINLQTTVRHYIAATEVGNAQNTVGVSSTLPLSLLNFKAAAVNGHTLLEWTTANETNSNLFEIERSGNNNSFAVIGNVNAGRTSYSFIDSFPVKPTAYYRLKMVDRYGQFTYSPVVAVTNKAVSIYSAGPSPFSTSIVLKVPGRQSLQISLTDVAGNIVLRKIVTGENTIHIDDLGRLPAGTYILQAGSYRQKLIKL
ncbi:MAG TPA: T9SS type A sorting domain-containing protein, partial [Chitinophagaceae bacterium]|nr:T9SS type A sorting domain-containing protein [Chitinophagaceae bacterium]